MAGFPSRAPTLNLCYQSLQPCSGSSGPEGGTGRLKDLRSYQWKKEVLRGAVRREDRKGYPREEVGVGRARVLGAESRLGRESGQGLHWEASQ